MKVNAIILLCLLSSRLHNRVINNQVFCPLFSKHGVLIQERTSFVENLHGPPALVAIFTFFALFNFSLLFKRVYLNKIQTRLFRW